jgi:hypothetical protein
MRKFVSLGTECVEYLKATRASQGNLLSCVSPVPSAFLCFLIPLFFPSCAADALSAANAHISSLEAELEASRKAFDAAAAAKTTAEKSTKSALARAKKAEKALSNANQGRIQRGQAVTERLNKILALARGKYHVFPFFVGLPILKLTDVCFLIFCLCPFCSLEHTGVSLAPLQPDDDPLLAAVNLLESN